MLGVVTDLAVDLFQHAQLLVQTFQKNGCILVMGGRHADRSLDGIGALRNAQAHRIGIEFQLLGQSVDMAGQVCFLIGIEGGHLLRAGRQNFHAVADRGHLVGHVILGQGHEAEGFADILVNGLVLLPGPGHGNHGFLHHIGAVGSHLVEDL